MRAKTFELLDFPRFGKPSISSIAVADTAASLGDRQIEKSFMSYNSLWPRLNHVVRFGASESYLASNFSFYEDDWKNKALQSAMEETGKIIGGKGSWYRLTRDVKSVAGFVFKTSIRGVWFDGSNPHALLINPRKSQRLSLEDIKFLARGIYELYCIDDPNDPVPMIIDLSAEPGSRRRNPACYSMRESEAMSLEAFEETVRLFLEAMSVAGLSNPVPPERHVVDLLKGRTR